jgi:hypothetical protein
MTLSPAGHLSGASPDGAKRRVSVLLRLERDEPAHGDVVMSAAMQLFTATDPVDLAIRLRGVPDPAETDAVALAERCSRVCPHPDQLPEIVLLAEAEEPEHTVVLEVEQGVDVAGNARAVILLAALAQEIWGGQEQQEPPPAGPPGRETADFQVTSCDDGTSAPASGSQLVLRDPALGGVGRTEEDDSLTAKLSRLTSTARQVPDQGRPGHGGLDRYLTQMRAMALQQIAAADEERRRDRIGAGGRLRAAVLVQHLDSWGSLETIADALREHPRVDLDVVALDSSLSRYRGETSAVLAQAGWQTRDEAWLRASMSGLDVMVLCDGYDEFRPEGLRVPDLAAAGIRLVYSPYGTNIGGEQTQERRQYDGLLHNIAWRVFAPTTGQRELFARRCTAGDGHVRTVGSVKRERVLALRRDPSPGTALREATGSELNVLWNPHFTIAEDGWSTFLMHVEPMLSYFASTRRDLGLIIRPHFRLLLDLARIPALAKVNRTFRATCERQRNVVLDDSRDYLSAFAAADALLSDQSSLIPEYLPLRRPVLYLHRPGGAPLNSDAAFMAAIPAAERWSDVADFLGDVVAGRAAAPDADRIGAEHLGEGDDGAGGRVAECVVEDVMRELDLS